MEVEHSVRKRGSGEQDRVRVMVRVRPFLPRELQGLGPHEYPMSVVHMEGNVVVVDGMRFSFDEAFWSIPDSQRQITQKPFADQVAVFETVGLPTVRHALNGYHNCILAYGQTGSGKTHSILGTLDDPGVAPRIVEELFAQIERQQNASLSRGFRHTVEISFFEIYNERVKDLFALQDSAPLARRGSSAQLHAFQSFRRSSSVVATPPSHVQSAEMRRRPSAGNLHSVGSSRRLSATPPPPRRRGSEVHSPPPQQKSSSRPPSRSGTDGQPGSAHSEGTAPADDLAEREPTASAQAWTSGRRRSRPTFASVDESGGRRRSLSDGAQALPPSPLGQHGHHGRRVRSAASSPTAEPETDYRDLRCRQSPQHGTFVEGLRRLGPADGITSADAVKQHMRWGMRYRATAETQMNSTSSRSHAIFQLCVKSHNNRSGVQRYAHINLVDLAGSERIKMSGAEGDRFVEATRINLSLSTLRRVIDTLILRSRGERHHVLPWRESLLTYVLHDSLGGNSRTVMFSTVSPAVSNKEDTINTLKYAQKARDIVNTVYVNEQKTTQVMSLMMRELQAMRKELEEHELRGDSDGVDQLRKELQARERDYGEATAEIARYQAAYQDQQEETRHMERLVRGASLKLIELQEQGIEDEHTDEQRMLQEKSQSLHQLRQQLESSMQRRAELDQLHERERRSAARLDRGRHRLLQQGLALEQEMARVRKRQVSIDVQGLLSRRSAEMRLQSHGADLKALDERQRAAMQELDAVNDQLLARRCVASAVGSRAAHAELRLAHVDETRGAEVAMAQAALRALRAGQAEASARALHARQQLTAVTAAVAAARALREEDSAEAQERTERVRLRAAAASEELECKRELVQQLGLQLSALRREGGELREAVAAERAAARERTQRTRVLREAVEGAQKDHLLLNRQLALARQLVRDSKDKIGAMRERSLKRRGRVETVVRNHDDLKQFVAQRFFPTRGRPDPAPPPFRNSAPGLDLPHAPGTVLVGSGPGSPVRCPRRSQSISPQRAVQASALTASALASLTEP
eukprot:TRINITY_DN2370_c0_g4_i1.p1 TRINITY_DN2370_c0_g4~~TRINITY_DN2370_c0_g4_i1.p1  ORF type:complete len:1069 (+),score=354.38 TRINITY_DN2370_c0_g4_i1:93-3209(+)